MSRGTLRMGTVGRQEMIKENPRDQVTVDGIVNANMYNGCGINGGGGDPKTSFFFPSLI